MQNDKRVNYKKLLIRKYMELGTSGMLEHEVLELILLLSAPRRNVRSMSANLLEQYITLNAVQDAPLDDLLKMPQMDVASAINLKLARDCSELYLKKGLQQKNLHYCGPDLIKYLIMSMARLRHEVFKTVFLNIQGEIIDVELIQEGTLNQAVVYPRKVMERALHHNAAGLIFVHNHPSGNIRPSREDRDITELLMAAASAMDMEVFDHIIVAGNTYYSFRDKGVLFSINEKRLDPAKKLPY